MKVFILPTSYPNSHNPQKDIFIYEQAKQLSNMGHDVVVLHVEKLPTKDILKPFSNKISEIDDGFAIRFTKCQKTLMEDRFPLINRDGFVRNMEKLYLEAVDKKGEPDVLYAHFSCWAGFAGAVLSQKYKIPLVTIEHFGGLLGNNVKKSIISGVSYTRKNSKQFIAVSENLKQSIKRLDRKNTEEIRVIPNMVDSCFLYSPRNNKENINILSIGNLNKGKDFSTLIKAFCVAFSKEEKVCLRIGGGGPEEASLKALIEENERVEQITLLGRLTRAQTMEEYRNCDCFAMASRFETYGIVYREALAIGRPIISTNHGGFSKYDWHDDYGYMVPVNDVNTMANAMKMMVNTIDGFDGEKISKLCLNDCGSDIVGKKIEEALLDAVNM